MNMKLKVACLLITLVYLCPALAQEELPILTNYSGRIYTDTGFFRDDQFKDVHPLAKETIIRNTNDYNLFTARLPAMEPLNTKGDDHPNDDPLFKKPVIDFTKHMMAAVVRDNMYVPAKITRATISNQIVIIEYTEEELGGWAVCQQEGGLGMYCAVLLPKTDKKIQFKGTTTKSTQPEPDGDSQKPVP
jgi:hypothetical protein